MAVARFLGSRWLVCLALLAAVPLAQARAQVGSARYASLVMDASSGQILEAANADEPRYPASLTKLMTIYMLFDALRDRRVSLDELVPVSAHAAAMPPSKLGLVPGSTITVQQALLGLVTKSANDAAAALGELMGGDEERFAQMMTLRARALGMTRTVFRNASGWPDPNQVTTAHDLALLAQHLIRDYPAEYHYFSVPSFLFHGRMIPNHDRMLRSYPGADGLKTGYIDASGCNLVTSAVRGDVRLIGVVMGTVNGSERDSTMTALLDAGFEHMGVPVSRVPFERFDEPALLASAAQATLPPASLHIVHRRGGRREAARLAQLAEPPVRHSRHERPTPHRTAPAHATARPVLMRRVMAEHPLPSPPRRPTRAASAHAGGARTRG